MNLETVFQYLDKLDSGVVDVDLFLDYLVPRLNALKQNILKAMYYTIQRNIGLVSKKVSLLPLEENNSKVLPFRSI